MNKILICLFLCISSINVWAASNNLFSKDIGDNIPADNVNGIKYLKRKIAFGVDGTAIDVSSANPLPVTVTSGGGSAPLTGTCPNASFATASVGTGSATTFTAPAHAIGIEILNESTTANPIRFLFGGTATSSNGLYYEAGRDTGFMPFSTNLSVIALVGTANVDVQWCLSQ